MDYKNGKVYKLQCEDGHYYIGSTATELRKRFWNHKFSGARQRPTARVYQHINALGWDKVRIVLVEDFPCESKEHLLRKEDEHIRACRDDPLCLNMFSAVVNKEEAKANGRIASLKHYHAHKDEIKARRRKTDSSASS
jgi:predicted GIY-YIG superfamily endonuclease